MPVIHSKPQRGVDPSSELTSFEAFRKLGKEWHVFHSVAWIGLRGGRVGDGEADFVLVHPKHGAMVAEVKGGGIVVDRGRWRSVGRHGEFDIKDPYRQATESKVALHKWFSEAHDLQVPTAHCVIFPDLSTIGALGPHAPPEITITLRDLADIERTLLRIAHHWNMRADLNARALTKIARAIAPKTSARRMLADDAYEAQLAIVELTQEQVRAFAAMRRNRRVVVFGRAGTGKSILALEKAAEFREQGGQVALLCFNRLLATHLAKDPRMDGVTVKTFHAFCMHEMRRAGLSIPDRPHDAWWEEAAAEGLVEALSASETEFDGLVIDEGQDFSKNWIDALDVAGAQGPDTPFYIFADEKQDLWPRDWTPDGSWAVYELTVNCRNTDQIARRIDPISPGSANTRGAQGPECRWTDIPTGTQPETVVARIVERLQGQGFATSELCVICEDPRLVSRLREMSDTQQGCRAGCRRRRAERRIV